MEAGSRSPESELPELPRDRESLLGLRSQVAMELVWIKQAIASRQKVSSAVVFDGKGLFLSPTPFSLTAVPADPK